MKTTKAALILVLLFTINLSYSATKDNITVDKIEIYTEKSKIPDLGTGGSSIPAGTSCVENK